MSDSEDHVDDIIDDGGDDLFGGDDGDDAGSRTSEQNGRVLSDRDLASEHGDDDTQEQDVRHDDSDMEDAPVRHINVEKVAMYRHRIPKSKNDQLISFRVPQFVKFHPEEYKADTYEPTRWDTDNAQSAAPVPVVRYRRDPTTGKMQSNANVYRWSDGSVTLAVGDEHYEIQTKDLAPPSNKAYNELKDAHYYTAAANLSSNTLMIVGHLTEQYMVKPNKEFDDDAVERLQRQLNEAALKSKNTDIITMPTEDPELQKKQAELAEKERNRAQRKREAAAARMDGLGAGYNKRGGALSIGEIEGSSRRGAAGGRKKGGAAPKKARRNNEYDSDDDLPSGAGRHDDYEEDGFVVGSDEEEEVGDDDDDEELLDDDEEEEEEKPKRKRARTEDADEDGEGDDDDGAPATSSRRRRRVVNDDEDDE